MHLHNQLFNSQDVDLSDEKLEIVKKTKMESPQKLPNCQKLKHENNKQE